MVSESRSGGETVQMTIRIPKSMKERAELEADRRGFMDLSEFVRASVRSGLEDESVDNIGFEKGQSNLNQWFIDELAERIGRGEDLDSLLNVAESFEKLNKITDRSGDDSGDDDNSDGFSGDGPGDFIKWFFDSHSFGVRHSFANLMAEKCRIRGELPDESDMANALLNGNSAVSNSHEAGMIAEVYEEMVSEYFENGNGR